MMDSKLNYQNEATLDDQSEAKQKFVSESEIIHQLFVCFMSLYKFGVFFFAFLNFLIASYLKFIENF